MGRAKMTITVAASKQSRAGSSSMRDKYRYIGPVYDFLSNLYSGKNIHRCKTAMLEVETVKPGDRILFAGVGHGRDAIRAAELGADVTVVDLRSEERRVGKECRSRWARYH